MPLSLTEINDVVGVSHKCVVRDWRTMPHMSNHFDIALRKLQKADEYGERIAGELAKDEPDRVQVGIWANRQRAFMKRAEVHAQLATVQALQDQTSAILESAR